MQFPEAGQPDSVLLRLRHATSDQHEAIERQLGLASSFTRDHYLHVLQGFDAFLQSWESLVVRDLPVRLKRWAEQGFRHADLRHDLKVLGLASREPAALAIPLASRAASLGSLYVLEGSALGAQVIAPRLEREHGLGTNNGGRYFSPDPARAASRWRDFRHLLDLEITTPSASRQACAAAVATFQALAGVFQPILQTHEASTG